MVTSISLAQQNKRNLHNYGTLNSKQNSFIQNLNFIFLYGNIWCIHISINSLYLQNSPSAKLCENPFLPSLMHIVVVLFCRESGCVGCLWLRRQ